MKHTLRKFSLLVCGLISALLQGCAKTPPAPTLITDISFQDPKFALCLSIAGLKQLDQITEIDCTGYGIQQVDEIRFMPNLKVLQLSNNRIKAIDTSANPFLEQLILSNNKLTTLEVSGNPQLQRLLIENNKITTINITGLNKLSALYAYKNPITTLDLSSNTELKDLGVSRHQLTMLDLSKAPKLRMLNVTRGNIQSLDLRYNPMLVDLRASSNALTTLELPLDSTLNYINVEQNQLTTLDVSHSTLLRELHAGQNLLTDVIFGHNDKLQKISLNHNQLSQLDLTFVKNPKAIVLFQNPLETLLLPVNFDNKTLSADNTPWGEKHMGPQTDTLHIEALTAGLISQHNGQFEVNGPAIVLADIGDYVGMQYAVSWPSTHSSQTDLPHQFAITIRVTHPTITPPNGGTPFTVSSWKDNMYLHDKNLALWQFTEDWELIEGRWQFEVLYLDKVVAKKAILVQKAP